MRTKVLTAVVLVAAIPLLAACGASRSWDVNTSPLSTNGSMGATGTGPMMGAKTGTVAVAAATATAPTSGPVAVKLSEMKITPSVAAAKAGKVTFDVQNVGKIPHEMVVLKTDKPAGALGAGARIPETGSVGEVGELAAGKSGKVTLKLAKGNYVLVCNIAGHYMAGMHAPFVVS